jgi:hypothetical protein
MCATASAANTDWIFNRTSQLDVPASEGFEMLRTPPLPFRFNAAFALQKQKFPDRFIKSKPYFTPDKILTFL